MKIQVNSTNSVVKAIADGSAPRPAQIAAAKGILPLPQADLLEALVLLSENGDEEISSTAGETLANQSEEDLLSVISGDEAPPLVLDYFSKKNDHPFSVQEAIATNPNTPAGAIISMARATRSPELLDQISFNQQLLIQNPELIDVILENPNHSNEAKRRAEETKKEFFEKERGAEQIARELRAQGKEAAAEFIENAEFAAELNEEAVPGELSVEDALILAEHIEVPDSEVDDSWLGLEFIEEIYEESESQRKANAERILSELAAEDEATAERISLISKVMMMGIRDRMKLAMKGDREARTVLIRDSNKLVSTAVVQNPKITDQEVERIAAMRTVNQDVLRLIATNKQWARSYKIIHLLAQNPKTPLPNAMSILPRLQMTDLMSLSNNRNVPEAVRKNALRIANTRRGR